MKKVLLLGEFSGLHTNLKEGLLEFGYDVKIASSGDGQKKINGDIDLKANSTSQFGIYKELKRKISEFKGYDVVQFINPYISNKVAVLLYNSIFNNNDKIFTLACGDDVEFIRFVKSGGMEKYSPFGEDIKMGRQLPYDSRVDKILHTYFMNRINGVIPVLYEYAESYRRSKYKEKVLSTIPLPINTQKIEYHENRVNGKIVIYHGITRPEFKGSKYIIEAMEDIKRRYPNEVEIIHADFLPLNEYLDVINRANIIIDQCQSYSYGMNALYSMAKGKVVLSGAEVEGLSELGVIKCPVVNITPNTEQIFGVLEELISRKNEIPSIGEQSRNFVIEHHDYLKIAEKYINHWNCTGFENE